MAQAPTLYQFDITLNHTDRGISEALNIRTPRHPSETMPRLWLRVLAYCWHWREGIAFGAGLSDPDAPDVLANDLTGQLRLWVRVGKADPIKIQRVANQNSQAKVAVFFESPAKLAAFNAEGKTSKVELRAADPALIAALAADEERRCKCSVTIAGDHFYIERNGASFDGAVG